jgi:DNA-directed RNA polymerase specialized sigma24 family protein|tara:strand:- start:51 stop:566 length:516 start_codon:yes stop_codon:yes gene_type:complete
MKTPKGMTEQQVVDQIDIVCNRIAPRYTFYGYTVDDIKQESFIICMEALNRYDGIRPLENFLSVNLSNRLKNFVRDNHFLGNENTDRQKVYQPAQLDYEDYIVDQENKFSITYDHIQKEEIVDAINKYLPANMRMDYLKMINDVYITKQRREEITAMIVDILQEHGYHEEG